MSFSESTATEAGIIVVESAPVNFAHKKEPLLSSLSKKPVVYKVVI
jgi:hypothetical protein